MQSLADVIEEYILSLIEKGEGIAEMQRALIAEQFRCVPSQISYVIASRFPPERGYITESRRGGGGYIRVTRVNLEDEDLREVISGIGPYLSQEETYDYLERLLEEGYIDAPIFEVMKAATSRNALVLGLPARDLIRANILKAMLNAYFSAADKDADREE